MKRIKIDLKKDYKQELNEIVKALELGKVVVLPTDTVYGLSCLATNVKAIEKIHKTKGIKNKKPLLILAKSFCMIRKHCFLNKRQYNYLKNELELGNATTVILKNRQKLPVYYSQMRYSGVAIRIPKQSDFLMRLLKKINIPLISTSLNVTGQKPIDDVNELKKHFKNTKLDLVVDAGKLPKKKPSKIVDIRNDEIIIRK